MQKRKAVNLTTDEASKMVHKTRRTWNRYESGQMRIPPEVWELFLLKSKSIGNWQLGN